ncbi:MAG: hypothetical protein PHH70_04750, partial [Candidatus Gracilibacteria bacterium]|nr:hypothetical protein [Candidatus Gracilibacteria bacterium]
EQQIKTDKKEYQKAIATFAESERSNLQTLNTFGIDLFGQDGAEAFLGQLNQQRKLQAMPPIELGTEFTREMRNNIAIGFRDQILGAEGKSLIITNGNGDTTLSPEPGTRERIAALLNQKGFNAKISNPTQKILEAFKKAPSAGVEKSE